MQSRHNYKIIKNSSNINSFDFHYFYKDLYNGYPGYSLQEVRSFSEEKLKNLKNYLYLSSIFEKNNDLTKIHKLNTSIRSFELLNAFAENRSPKKTLNIKEVKEFIKLLNLDSFFTTLSSITGQIFTTSKPYKMSKLCTNENALGCARYMFNDIANFYAKKNIKSVTDYFGSSCTIHRGMGWTFVPILLSLVPIIRSDNFSKKAILDYEKNFPYERYKDGLSKDTYEMQIPNIIKSIVGLDVSEEAVQVCIKYLKEDLNERYWRMNGIRTFIYSFIAANGFDSFSSFIKKHSSIMSTHYTVRAALYSGFIYAGKFTEECSIKLKRESSQAVQVETLKYLGASESLYDFDNYSCIISKFISSNNEELVASLFNFLNPKYRYLFMANPIARKIGSEYTDNPY